MGQQYKNWFFFLDYVSMLWNIVFATKNTILFTQQFVCGQYKQAIYFVLQDMVRTTVNAGILIPQKPGTIRKPSDQSRSMRHTNVSGNISAEE